MKALSRNTKILAIIGFTLLPYSMYSDGGMSTSRCSSYVYYDIQPAKTAKLRLVLSSFKINGKTQQNNYNKKFIGPSAIMTRLSEIDTLTINNLSINNSNTEITGFELKFPSYLQSINYSK